MTQKAPSFPFYYRDWLHAVRRWSAEEKIEYLEMLCEQADSLNGYIDPDVFTIECQSPRVKTKFVESSQGWYNERMLEILYKRKKHSEQQKENASKRWHKDGTAAAMPLENENENENEDVNRKGKGKGKKKKEGSVRGATLLRTSEVGPEWIGEAFAKTTDLVLADPLFYYNAMLDWSDGKAEKRTDWIAVARQFARRDLAAGTLHRQGRHRKQGTNLGGEKLPASYGTASDKAVPMPDSLKKHFGNIGKEPNSK